MKNKEKYAKEIVDAVTSGGYGFGFNKSSGEIRRCNEISCVECLFCESHGADECNKLKKRMGRIGVHRKASDKQER